VGQGSRTVAVPSPKRTYGLVIAVVVVMIVGSLLVPLIFGDPETTAVAGGGVTTGDLIPTDPLPPATADDTTTTTLAPGVPSDTVPDQGPASTGTGARPVLTASDVGVTASSIRIGVVVFDLESVGPLGLGLKNFEVETQKKVVAAFFDDINRRGGVYGRKLEPVFVANDPLDAADASKARAQCLKLTKDLKVFAVIGYISTSSPCVAVEQRTPVVSYNGDIDETYTSSRNYFISAPASAERVAREWADALQSLHLLAGKKVGILTGEVVLERRAADALQSQLDGHGTKTLYRANISADADAAVAQVPLEVQKMRSAGVDAVLLPTNFAVALTFVQAAEGQGWRPRYFTSDFGGLATDGLVRNAPPSFDGTIGFTYASRGRNADGSEVPYGPSEEACRSLYNSTTDGKDFADGEEGPLLMFCALTQILRSGLEGAGPNLTRAGLVAAVQHLGRLGLPNYIDGHFGPGRTDYAATVRPVRWGAACKCYTNAGGPIPPSG
jgi:ABC-type branched-subunit amino acid transport system substrate-binding protein